MIWEQNTAAIVMLNRVVEKNQVCINFYCKYHVSFQPAFLCKVCISTNSRWFILQVKCYQYWPCGQAAEHVDQLDFEDFKVYFLKEIGNDYFTIRTLELENFVVCLA